MARFPTVRSLAEASVDEVLQIWQGLGYYRRARNLLRGAREVVTRYQGRMPQDVRSLTALPGIGRYSAGAIASIAYGAPAPAVDGNVARVLCRLFALRGDPRAARLRDRLWELAAELLPRRRSGDFNQALMDLGATVCTPVNPRCGACPLERLCCSRRLGIAERLPEGSSRPTATHIATVAALIWRRGRLLLGKRRAGERRWASLWEFPATEVRKGETPRVAVGRAAREASALEVRVGPRAAVIRHSVTRYRITLEAYECETTTFGRPRALGHQVWRWVAPAELGDYALPAAHRAIARQVTGLGDGPQARRDPGLRLAMSSRAGTASSTIALGERGGRPGSRRGAHA
jgi:A/G-specific adenine glycosylase